MRICFMSAALAIATLCGCSDSGPPLHPVKGKVMLFGKPHPNATVVFEPKGGGPVGIGGPTNAAGEFEIWSAGRKGAIAGTHRVVISTQAPPGTDNAPTEMRSDDPNYQAQALGKPSDYAKKKEFKDPIPEKYNKASTLTFEVTGKGEEANFDLQ